MDNLGDRAHAPHGSIGSQLVHKEDVYQSECARILSHASNQARTDRVRSSVPG